MGIREKKKIAIFTLPLARNYGGILQAFALNKILTTLDYESYVLEVPINNLKYKIKSIVDSCNSIRKFIKKNIKTVKVSSIDENEIKNRNIDTIIVGSDQVWRKSFSNDLRYFLPNISGLKKIAYAASFGIDNWDYNEKETEIIKKSLNSFSGISVREESAINLCNDKLNILPHLVFDPTLLLNSSDYEKFVKKGSNTKYIFVYLLDYTNTNNLNFINNIKNERKLNIKQVSLYKNKLIKRILPTTSIENWLSYIYNSDIVITDSFHGCVFSILFNKEFYILPNNAGGNSRIFSLLKLVGLEDHIITDYKKTIFEEIDWKTVNSIIDTNRNKSINYLKRALLVNND